MKTKADSRSQENPTREQSSQETFTNLYPTLFDGNLTAETRVNSRNKLTDEAFADSDPNEDPCLVAKKKGLQTDASEYLGKLLDTLVLKEQKFETFTEVTPNACTTRQNNKSHTAILAIPLQVTETQATTSEPGNKPTTNPPKLSELLDIYSSAEFMTGDRQVYIDSDSDKTTKVDGSKREVVKAPNDENADLCISLKRFGNDNRGRSVKIDTAVDLDVVEIEANQDAKDSIKKPYEVTSFIIHRGTSVTSGHYYTYVKERVLDQNGSEIVVWAKYDDRERTEICLGDTLPPEASTAYVLKLSPLSDDYQSKTGHDRYKNGLPRAQTCGTRNTGNACWENAGFAFVASMWFPYIEEERKKPTTVKKDPVVSARNALSRVKLVAPSKKVTTPTEDQDLTAVVAKPSLEETKIKSSEEEDLRSATESGLAVGENLSVEETKKATVTPQEEPYLSNQITPEEGSSIIEDEVDPPKHPSTTTESGLAASENFSPNQLLEETTKATLTPQEEPGLSDQIIPRSETSEPLEPQTTTTLHSEPAPTPRPPIKVSTLEGELVQITATKGAWKDVVNQERGRNNDYKLVGRSIGLQEREVSQKTAEILRSLMADPKVKALNQNQNLTEEQVLKIIDVAINRGGIANKKNTKSNRPIYLKEAATSENLESPIAEDVESDDEQQEYVAELKITPELAKVFSALFQERSRQEGILSGRKGGKEVGRRLTFTSDKDIEAFKDPAKFQAAADRSPSASR